MKTRSTEEVDAILEKHKLHYRMDARPMKVMAKDGKPEGWVVDSIHIFRDHAGVWVPLEFDWNPKDTIHPTKDDAEKHSRELFADWLEKNAK
jgi:hypothetical protein